MTILLEGEAATADYAGKVVSELEKKRGGATVVALSGSLGAGKTTFTQGIARALGVEGSVTSPTYVIEKVYVLEGQKFSKLIHIDAYRLKDSAELEVLGWRRLLQDPENLIILEWPENVPGAVPEDAMHISFEGHGDSRSILHEKKYG